MQLPDWQRASTDCRFGIRAQNMLLRPARISSAIAIVYDQQHCVIHGTFFAFDEVSGEIAGQTVRRWLRPSKNLKKRSPNYGKDHWN